ncbi:MAG: DUF4145 domain-containing protein [Pseudomonadota bacterium]
MTFSFHKAMDCPWCAQEVDFRFNHVWQWRPTSSGLSEKTQKQVQSVINTMNQRRLGPRVDKNHQKSSEQINEEAREIRQRRETENTEIFAIAHCQRCKQPVIGRFQSNLSTVLMSVFQGVNGAMFDEITRRLVQADTCELIGTMPSPQIFDPPAYVPEEVAELWPNVLKGIRRGDPATTIVSQCRSIIDVCLKDLGATTGVRRERLNELRKKNILTAGLADWGQRVWKDGNDAIHDLKATMEDAHQHVSYLKLFFQVAYDLPAQIKEREMAAASSTEGDGTEGE